MVYRSQDPLDLGPRLATSSSIGAPRLSIALVVVQLPLLIGAVGLAVLQLWEWSVGFAVGYAIATLARLVIARRRVQVDVHEHGIAVVRGRATRAWRWDDLARRTSFAILTRAGERIPFVVDEAAVKALSARWVAHALAHARSRLSAGGAVAFKDDALRVRVDGIERFGVVAPWADAVVELRDGFVLVMSSFDQSLAMVKAGRRGAMGLSLHDSDVPEGPVFRALVREYRPDT
ncbi:MAG: hypothetical protein K8W52_36280 [Deltaproteobacteria bacterium]|nr:hypothetical protein [Deltaproteobacteria bacterium]